MKIGFVSYEYPPDTAFGGIATYVQQAAGMLIGRGHYVEVFTSSSLRSGTENQSGVVVHRVKDPNPASFPASVAPVFAGRHHLIKFDVLEGPEYSADARDCVRLVPTIPLVIKLHTPSFLVRSLSRSEPGLVGRVRRLFSGFIRASSNIATKKEIDDIEREHAHDADEIVAPSRAIAKVVSKAWGLDAKKLSCVPYPYVPTAGFLRIPAETHANCVTFLGRLETRKGTIDLADAVPLILRGKPATRFQFVGTPENSPKPDLDMRQFLERRLCRFRDRVEFRDGVPLENVAQVLASTDICVFPSVWENFPFVCLESMAAARGVVGSNSGGMVEMLDHGLVGKLVPPYSPRRIAKAVTDFLDHPELRIAMGAAARERVLSEYSASRIGPLQEASYVRAISTRAAAGSRHFHSISCKS